MRRSCAYSKVGALPDNQPKLSRPQKWHRQRQLKLNQDSFIVGTKLCGDPHQHLFAVADGHGKFGKEISGLVKRRLPGIVLRMCHTAPRSPRRGKLGTHKRHNEHVVRIGVPQNEQRNRAIRDRRRVQREHLRGCSDQRTVDIIRKRWRLACDYLLSRGRK